MINYKILTKRVAVIIAGLIGLMAVVFIGLYYFQEHPEALKKSERTITIWQPRNVDEDMANAFIMPDVKYGYDLLTQTQRYLGPQAENPQMRLSGNNLKCTSCHLDSGNRPGSGSWAGVTQRYPSFRGRSNAMGSIQDRINGCMERSMNGEKLDIDSREMRAMVAYMDWLSEGIPEDEVENVSGYTNLEPPNMAVDLGKGQQIFTTHCIECHQEDGQGLKHEDFKDGYVYPPLWGDDTFNDGAGMNRVLTAAQFIKANMPYLLATRENPVLTDEEAYHVAGYINSFKRPEKANKDKDYPDLKLKPVSTPYGPWEDDFTAEQHKFGPFPPIIAYYKEKYDIKKSK